MSLAAWIRLAMDGFDYVQSTIEENQKLSLRTVPDAPSQVPAAVQTRIAGAHRTSKKGLIELANYEGLANTLYLDSGGVKTIGIGMTTSEIKDLNNWPWDRTISTANCVGMFVEACRKYENAVNKALKVKVTQFQFDALVSITYNIGTGGMAGSTFMKRLNMGDTAARVVEAMQWWNVDNGKVIPGLITRRKAEGEVFKTGVYKNDGTVALIAVNPTTHRPSYKARVNIEQYL